jgi:flagellar hook-basal body complex protein FliE
MSTSMISNNHQAMDSMIGELRDIKSKAESLSTSIGQDNSSKSSGKSFSDHMMAEVKEVNNLHIQSDKMAADLATGKSENLHETMLAATKAEIGFNYIVQLRNKILDAYQEVMRMQV